MVDVSYPHIIYDADLGFIYGKSADGRLGWMVEVVDDIDGDGLPDLVVSAPQDVFSTSGKDYIITDRSPYGQYVQNVAAATITATGLCNAPSGCVSDNTDFDDTSSSIFAPGNCYAHFTRVTMPSLLDRSSVSPLHPWATESAAGETRIRRCGIRPPLQPGRPSACGRPS